MDSQGARCHWQIEKKRIRERLKRLLNTGQWSDCQFIVGSEPNQKIFNAHKLLLSMTSPVFEAMFFGELAEVNATISIPEVQPEIFALLLNYIYCEESNLTTFEQGCELYYAAKKYMLPDLTEKCVSHMLKTLGATNACKGYEFGKLFDEPDIVKKSLQIIESQAEVVLNHQSFEDVQLETLLFILDNEGLKISSELHLFNAVYRWAVKECLRNELPETRESLRGVIGPALEKIHLLTLTPHDFAKGPALCPLLNKDESFAILMNLSNRDADFPMPPRFSTVVKPRKRVVTSTSSEGQPPGNSGVIFCTRSVIPEAPCLNSNTLECSLIFSVSRPIYVIGIQIPTQIQIPSTSADTFDFEKPTDVYGHSYPEVVQANLLHSDGSRLTYTHFCSRVSFGEIIDITFNRRIRIESSQWYEITVMLSKPGWYPVGVGSTQKKCGDILFTFGREAYTSPSTGTPRTSKTQRTQRTPRSPRTPNGDSIIRSILYNF